MGALWVVAEPGPDGGLARISAEAATLVRDLATSAGHETVGIVIAPDPAAAEEDLAHWRTAGKNAAFEHCAENRRRLAARDQKTKTIERMPHSLTRIGQMQHGHRH